MKAKSIIAVILAGVIMAGCRGGGPFGGNGSENGDGAVAMSEQPLSQSGDLSAQGVSGEEEAGNGTQEDAADASAGTGSDAERRNVIMDIFGWAEDGGVRFEVDSSLPDGEIVSMTLTRGDFNTADCYQAGERIKVSDWKAVSNAFSNQGQPLSGNYDLALTIQMSEEQDLIIRSTNGEKSPSSIIIRAADVAKQLREAREAELKKQAELEAAGQEAALLQGEIEGGGIDAAGAAGNIPGTENAGNAAYGSTQETGKVPVTALFSVSVGNGVTVKFAKEYKYTIFRTEAAEDAAGDIVEENAQEEADSAEADAEEYTEEENDADYEQEAQDGIENDYIDDAYEENYQEEMQDQVVDEIVQ